MTTVYPSASTYLVKTVSTVAKASGDAFALLKPDVGQFWAPSIIRVSTGKTPQNTPVIPPGGTNINASYCAVFHGATNQANSSTFLDDTSLGSGDSSSIVAGTIVLYGESIMAQWTNVTAGDVCLLTIYGRSSDNLPALQQELSPIPGARFTGNSGNAMVWDYNDFALAGPGAFTGVGPALGASFVTPANLLCELVCVRYTATTDATVGARVFGVQGSFFDGTQIVPLFQAINPNGHAAGTTLRHTFSPGVVAYLSGTSPSGQAGAPVPSRLILPPLSTIQAIGVANGVGDTWSNFAVSYRQYRTLGKVSFP